MQLVKAIGEDVIDLSGIFPTSLSRMAERRLNHKRLDSIILDVGGPDRLLIQCTPTDVDDEFEIDILTLRLIDHPLQGEKDVPISDIVVQGIERITTDYEGQRITVGIRLISDSEPLDIIGGDVLASLAVYGWGFPDRDHQSAFPLSEYHYEPWF